MINLKNCKFGDKFMTRNGKIAVIIGGHIDIRKPFWEAVIGDPNMSFSEQWIDKQNYYADGTAQEGFTHLDLIK